MNIMDGMDAARFTSANPGRLRGKKAKKGSMKMPLVLRNLNNQ